MQLHPPVLLRLRAHVRSDNFDQVLEGFWLTIKLSILGGIFSLMWGLVLARAAAAPGRAAGARALADDRLHRCLPRDPAAAGSCCSSRAALGTLSVADRRGGAPEFIGDPTWLGQTVALLVRGASR